MGSDSLVSATAHHFHISIHAPRMGSDAARDEVACDEMYFNPRSPHGERLGVDPGDRATLKFQSTLPAWGATMSWRNDYQKSDYFNPRSPHGERLTIIMKEPSNRSFQSTLPAWGATTPAANRMITSHYFNPRSPHGERRLS